MSGEISLALSNTRFLRDLVFICSSVMNWTKVCLGLCILDETVAIGLGNG